MVMSLDKLVETYNLRINGVLHIGAHWGEEEPMYTKQGIKNMIFFEPIKSNYNMLLEMLPQNDNIKTFNIALGSTQCMIDMYVETWNKGQSCSPLEPKLHLTQYPHIKFTSKETVPVFRLDDIEFDRSKYNMINIDVQGYEMEVFKGAEATLNTIDIVYSEVNRDEVYEGCAKVWEIDAFLGEYGFYRADTDWIGKTWGDALYLKR